jgi:carboxypeptidase C (cathepsin A)
VFFVAYERFSEQAEAEQDSRETTPGEDSSGERKRVHEADSTRPLTFVFNGGPGAASVWLHLGTAGPKRIKLTPDGQALPPPYQLVENNHSWLDVTDLVFIDPVGTGFSRPAEGEKGEQFYGVQEDITWVADFIRLYITQFQRWSSPLFLAGESYGTTRAAGLSEHLLDRFGIALNGIMLISTVLDFQTLQPGEGNDTPFPLFLPTYTAAAWYHRRLAPELQQNLETTLREVEDWATDVYPGVLMKGAALSKPARHDAAARLARYTSLPVELVEKGDLRITSGVFQKHLLENQRRIIGRFDARITGYDDAPLSPYPSFDPSLSQYLAIYSSTFNDYVRRVLNYESDLPYEVLSDKVRPWNYGRNRSGYVFVADNLESAMIKNPHLRVLFASGYFDLATPYFATRYTANRMDLNEPLRANVTHTHYLGGHMMYHDFDALVKLKHDVRAFMQAEAGER